MNRDKMQKVAGRSSDGRQAVPAFEAFEFLSTAVIGLDAGGRIVDLNTAAESLLGRAKRTVRGTPISAYLEAAAI